MVNHVVEVLFQGVWSSLTGGWFYDSHTSLFINTIHMYTWLILFALPLGLYLFFDATALLWGSYVSITALFFLTVKLANYLLNQMFDKNQIRPVDNTADDQMTSSNDNEPNTYDRVADSSLNQFEMMPINGATMSDIDLTRLKQPNTDTSDMDGSKPTAVQIQDYCLHNSPTNRSLFKISEESLSNTNNHLNFDSKDQKESLSLNQLDDQNQMSFSRLIASGPSLQDTTVSDTKLHSTSQSKNTNSSRTIHQLVNDDNPKKVPSGTEDVRRIRSDMINACKHNKQSNTKFQFTDIEPSCKNTDNPLIKPTVDAHRAYSLSLDSLQTKPNEGQTCMCDSADQCAHKSLIVADDEQTSTCPKDQALGKQLNDAFESALYTINEQSVPMIQTPNDDNKPFLLLDERTEYERQGAIPKTILRQQPIETEIGLDNLDYGSKSLNRKRFGVKRKQHNRSTRFPIVQAMNDGDDDDDDDDIGVEHSSSYSSIDSIIKKPKSSSTQTENSKVEEERSFDETNDNTMHYFIINNSLFAYKFSKYSCGLPEQIDLNNDQETIDFASIPVDLLRQLNFKGKNLILEKYTKNCTTSVHDAQQQKQPHKLPYENTVNVKDLHATDSDLIRFYQNFLSTHDNTLQSKHLLRKLLTERSRPIRQCGEHDSNSNQASSSHQNIDEIKPYGVVDWHALGYDTADDIYMPSAETDTDKVFCTNYVSSTSSKINEDHTKTKCKYELAIGSKFKLTIPFDRYSLIAMLDINKHAYEVLISVVLACLVSLLASIILTMHIYDDLGLIWFCFLVASCHYSLLKSVQPDSSSPVHGFNRTVSYSRAVYFCLNAILIIGLGECVQGQRLFCAAMSNANGLTYHGHRIDMNVLKILKKLCETMLLMKPLLFLFGLYPQINTFCLSLIEQIDVYLFGGTSMHSLFNSVLAIGRSLIAIGMLSSILLLNRTSHASGFFVQTTVFSVYCAFLVFVSYMLSRQSSELTSFCLMVKSVLITLIRRTNGPQSPTKPISTESHQQQQPSQSDTWNCLPNKSQDHLANMDYNQMAIERHLKLIRKRFESDALCGIFAFLLTFVMHISTAFTQLQPSFEKILFFMAISVGVVNHYVLPKMRENTPWNFLSKPVFKAKQWSQFEVTSLAPLEWYECMGVVLVQAEKVLNILLIVSIITTNAQCLMQKFKAIESNANNILACISLSVISLKLVRNAFCQPSKQYQLYLCAYLFQNFDFKINTECYSVNVYVISIVLSKLYDFLDKLSFIFVYTAPWQLPWGSAMHAFAQPLSIPHSALLLFQVFLSSILNAPLMPVMGSAFFLLSYMRPNKFWEKSYNTKRIDNTVLKLQNQFGNTSLDNENLNSTFYEHLTVVLQQTLYGDILLGRWGPVDTGDFFILSSDYLNCLIHIIELGNGFVTFQLRGLEFKGTYCQQRELEVISDDLNVTTSANTSANANNQTGCCCSCCCHKASSKCCKNFKCLLTMKNMFNLRWIAWQVVSRKYVVDAYRITDNDLSLIINFYSLRRTLIDFYTKSIIFYAIVNMKLNSWLTNDNIRSELAKIHANAHVDMDTCFDSNLDSDYDVDLKGVSYSKFCFVYLRWIAHCNSKRQQYISELKLETDTGNGECQPIDDAYDSDLVKFCFILSLACRRALMYACNGQQINFNSDQANAVFVSSEQSQQPQQQQQQQMQAQQTQNAEPESLTSFQYGYYKLFKGDIRIQSVKDEWIFNDIDILKQVAVPSVRMSLRLHQDHFQFDQIDEQALFDNLIEYNRSTVITYERDPLWRNAILNNVHSLLGLRYNFNEFFSGQYKVIMLNKSQLSFRVIKLNKECVRSFWAGQQNELIFLRNNNQERGSIQNAKQVLRNIINSSCDQPIGYPIYVSPLTISYSSTHTQLQRIIGPELSLSHVALFIWTILKRHVYFVDHLLSDIDSTVNKGDFWFHSIIRIYNSCTNDCFSGSANNPDSQPNATTNVTYTRRTNVCQIAIPPNAISS